MKTTYMKLGVSTIQKMFLFIALFAFTGATAKNYSYQLYVANQVQVSPTVFQFDVFVLNTSTPSGTQLEMAGVQFGIGFDASIANGGQLSASVIQGTSELNSFEAPNTVMISNELITVDGIANRYFNCAGRIPPGAGHGTVISGMFSNCNHPGTRVGTFRLTNTVPFSSNSTPRMVFSERTGKGCTMTALTAYRTTSSGGTENFPVTGTHVNYNSANNCAHPVVLNGPNTSFISNDADGGVASIYPNPTHDQVFLELPAHATPSIYHLFITDNAGNTVYTNEELKDMITPINVADYARGFYLLNLVDKDGNKTVKKLSIQ
jgi:hypothetical protein